MTSRNVQPWGTTTTGPYQEHNSRTLNMPATLPSRPDQGTSSLHAFHEANERQVHERSQEEMAAGEPDYEVASTGSSEESEWEGKGIGHDAYDDDKDPYRCVCAMEEDPDVATQDVCCDGCEKWQHVICMAQTEEDVAPEKEYYCHICRPEAHHDICVGIEQGELAPRHRANVMKEVMKMFADIDWLRSYWDDMLELGHWAILEKTDDGLSKDDAIEPKKKQVVQKNGGKGTGKKGKHGKKGKKGNKKKAGKKAKKPTADEKDSEDESEAIPARADNKLDGALARAAGGLRMRERIDYSENSSKKSNHVASDTESEFEAESNSAASTKPGPDPETEPTLARAPLVFQPFSVAGAKAGLQALFDRFDYDCLFSVKEGFPKVVFGTEESSPKVVSQKGLEMLVDHLRGEAASCWNGEQREEVLAMGTFAEVLRICPKGYHKLAEDPVAFQKWYDAQTGVVTRYPEKSASKGTK